MSKFALGVADEGYGGVVSVAFLVCKGLLLFDIHHFRFREILEDFFWLLVEECNTLPVQEASEDCGIVGIANELCHSQIMLASKCLWGKVLGTVEIT